MIKITEYNQTVSFGGIFFQLGNVRPTEKPSTLKTNVGKMFIEKQIPLRNTKDTVLQINGVITGLSRAVGETLSTAIERDRLALVALDDGFKHAYNDGKHSGNFAIVQESLVWEDEAARSSGEPYKFTVTFVEWK